MRNLLLASCLALFACPSPVGSEGPKGDPGPQGAVGPAGAQGAVGPAGPQGVAGAEGAAGAAGTTGPAGAQGADGPQGVQGPAGQVLVVDGGVVVGPPGSSVIVTPVTAGGQPCPFGGIRVTQLSDAGISTVCNGAPGATGAAVTATPLAVLSAQCVAGGLLIGLPDGGSVALCNGAAGAAGSTGPAGIPGMTGATGGIGPIGPAGATGPAGAPGATGSTGGAGPAGPPGMTGSAGTAGAAGPTGAAGPAGPPGPAGAVLFLDGGYVLPPGASGRPTFAGYTTAVSQGSYGGRPAANGACAAQFPGAHVCTGVEYAASRPTIAAPAPGALLDSPGDDLTREPGTFGSCQSFQNSTTSYNAYVALPGGNIVTNSSTVPNCTSSMPLACCSTPTGTRLRGFSTQISTATIGGRSGANARCALEFSGSHVCTGLEAQEARSALPIPSPGAFLDSPGNVQTRDPGTFGSCQSFQNATTSYNAYVLLPGGNVVTNSSTTPNCTVMMPLACCD